MEQGDPAVKVKQEDAISDVSSGVDHLPVKSERADTWPVKLEVDIADTPIQCWPKKGPNSYGEHIRVIIV